jgi:hypothetical protein
LRRIFVEQRLDQRRLARSARTGEQHIVRRLAGDKVARVGVDARFLLVDVLQVAEPDRRQARDRLQIANAAAGSPAESAGQQPSPGNGEAGGSKGSIRSRKLFGADEEARNLPEMSRSSDSILRGLTNPTL